jgi:hypothetical protein
MKLLLKILSFGIVILFIGCNKNDCEEQVVEDCVMTYELNPVCGCNEKTYANPSIASCHGIEEFTLGACQ